MTDQTAPRPTPIDPGRKSGHCVRDNDDPCWCGDLHYYENPGQPADKSEGLEDAGPLSSGSSPRRQYDHSDPSCMCPSCHSERLTYCTLTRGWPTHPPHLIPECPSVFPPGQATD